MAARREKLELSDYLPYLVNRLGAALVLRFTEDALARHGLGIAMWRVLVALSDAGPQRQIDLAEITSIDVSTLSRLVSRLLRCGLVTRVRSAKSNREVAVRLTAQGESAGRHADPGRARAGADARSRACRRASSPPPRRRCDRMYANLSFPSPERGEGG